MLELAALGKRIMIIGPTSSGKSTLAHALGEKFGFKYYHLDTIAHIPNTQWVRKPNEEFIAEHNQIIVQDTWVIDGNYSSCMQERMARATTVIWLDYAPWYSAFRFIKRALGKSQRYGMLNGAEDSVNIKMLKFALFQYPKNAKKYTALLQQYPNIGLVKVRNINQLEKLYKAWNLNR